MVLVLQCARAGQDNIFFEVCGIEKKCCPAPHRYITKTNRPAWKNYTMLKNGFEMLVQRMAKNVYENEHASEYENEHDNEDEH